MDSAISGVDSSSAFRSSFREAEMDVVGLCARPVLSPAHVARLRRMVEQSLDWRRVLDRAQVHGVVGMVYHHLAQYVSGRVPPDTLSVMRQCSRQIQINNLQAMRELVRIAGVFNSADVPLLTFKGPLLAHRYYGNVAFRHFGDVDLLVHRDDLGRAQSLLVANGYRPARSLSDAEEAQWRREQLGREFLHVEQSILVELHWALLNRTLAFHLDANDAWKCAERYELGSAYVSVLAPDELLLYLCAHGTKHHWSRLQCVCDVACVLDHHPDLDWEALLAKAQRTGNLRTLTLGLCLTERWLGNSLPPVIRSAVDADPMIDRLVGEIETRWFGTEEGIRPPAEWSTFWFIVRTRQRLRDNRAMVGHYLRLAVTPTEKDRAFVPISVPSVLEPLYYLVRPVRLLRDALSSTLGTSSNRSTEPAKSESSSAEDAHRPPLVHRGRRLVQKFRERSWAERRDLVAALCIASLVAGLIHTCSFRRALRIVDRWSRGSSATTGSLSDAEERRLLGAVEAAARRVVPQKPCLTQALTARIMLARRGARPTELQIGVARNSDGSLSAHAWLERNGTVLTGGEGSPNTYSMLSPWETRA